MKYLFKMFFPVVVCTTCDSIDHMHACSETRELEGYGDVKPPPKKKKKKKDGNLPMVVTNGPVFLATAD